MGQKSDSAIFSITTKLFIKKEKGTSQTYERSSRDSTYRAVPACSLRSRTAISRSQGARWRRRGRRRRGVLMGAGSSQSNAALLPPPLSVHTEQAPRLGARLEGLWRCPQRTVRST